LLVLCIKWKILCKKKPEERQEEIMNFEAKEKFIENLEKINFDEMKNVVSEDKSYGL
jgi:hypothetical protein